MNRTEQVQVEYIVEQVEMTNNGYLYASKLSKLHKSWAELAVDKGYLIESRKRNWFCEMDTVYMKPETAEAYSVAKLKLPYGEVY